MRLGKPGSCGCPSGSPLSNCDYRTPQVQEMKGLPGAVGRFLISGGERGIRTLDRVSPIHAFQACAFNRSAISPGCLVSSLSRGPVSLAANQIVEGLAFADDTPLGAVHQH